MKIHFYLLLTLGLLAGCNSSGQKTEEKTDNANEATEQTVENVTDKTFEELFISIVPAELPDNVFKLVGQDFTVITAGTESDYNSMTASWGGWGIMFNEPVTWCFLRANRYTLEYMKRERVYTMSYFDDPYKDQVIFFGSSSGRDSDKMKKHTLTAVKTPIGSISYKEAKLIVECELTEITTVQPDDFYTAEGKIFVTDAHKEAKEYHKIVFGKISNIWIKK
ncbi:MAG: flavin reductase [Dysgonamonadaceae bacterium]|jgi:flavin reductase (DIM6/NTAB) family NADH-FMN oxidoreductase RutF|nr:flavin reductase [Dysgonamonadaceae bacterium]